MLYYFGNKTVIVRSIMKWYKFDIRKFSDEEYEKWYSLMSEEKKIRVSKFRNIDDKKRTVAGEMLARNAISEICGVNACEIAFLLTEFGKPYVKDLNAEFNISHSNNMVVCAIHNIPIGIDVEEIRPIDLLIAKRVCDEEELKYIFGYLPNDEDFKFSEDLAVLKRFFEIWTAKEAHSKCVGKGLSIITQPANCHFKKTIFDEEYIISIAY